MSIYQRRPCSRATQIRGNTGEATQRCCLFKNNTWALRGNYSSKACLVCLALIVFVLCGVLYGFLRVTLLKRQVEAGVAGGSKPDYMGV